jgi:hypothetical protein
MKISLKTYNPTFSLSYAPTCTHPSTHLQDQRWGIVADQVLLFLYPTNATAGRQDLDSDFTKTIKFTPFIILFTTQFLYVHILQISLRPWTGA